MIEELKQFNFDIIAHKTSKFKRFKFIYAMFHDINIIQTYDVSQEKFLSYLKKTEYFYERNKNPYHNFEHAITGIRINQKNR